MSNIRKIVHIDMDAFFAAVEIRDNPTYKNKPLIIGGTSLSFGVVSTCSYEARKYGIHSAMSTKQARQLCPHGIFISGNMEKYKQVSQQLHKIFHKYTDIVEPLSLDEAFLDVTKNKLQLKSATKIALLIQKEIKLKLNLTCSCGVSYNKFLAKSATEINKPNGYYVITPTDALDFLDILPIQKFYGIGKKTAEKMISLGIYTGHDLKNLSLEFLTKHFNTRGKFYYNVVRGIDHREVVSSRVIKSISKETTFYTLISGSKEITSNFLTVFNFAFERLYLQKFVTKTITIKIKYSDFSYFTKSFSANRWLNNKNKLLQYLFFLIEQVENLDDIRLIGVSFSNLKTLAEYEKYFKPKFIQLKLI